MLWVLTAKVILMSSHNMFLARLSQRLIGELIGIVCCPHSLNISETIGPIKIKFHMELWDGGMKVCSNGPGLLTKMATMPIYGKNLLQNQKADDLETWCAASGAWVLPSLFKWWPWVDLDLLYGKVKFGLLCFCTGKRGNNGFFRKYRSLWYQSL